MKDSPQEIGFVIGGVVGIIWLLWAKVGGGTRNGGTAMYLLIMICGGIGWGIGWLVSAYSDLMVDCVDAVKHMTEPAMHNKLTYYRTAFYLSLVVALTPNLFGWWLLIPGSFTRKYVAIFVNLLLISFGLWVQSVVVSSIGLLYMLVWAGALIWPVASQAVFPQSNFKLLLAVFFVISAALDSSDHRDNNLTKKFRTEL